ncbi:hypothetical protein IWQ62_004316 [Dispira parvispora]|uniref:ethanolamine kinase n=1 Tax=Dispira parvispora TaxID=1520584 RepID=A0A9W8AL41_9FUNG|nr:hypothetical protein IWQ62_004316 [Dispira parvispora]
MSIPPTLELPSLTVLPLTVSHKRLLEDSKKAVLALFPHWSPEDLRLVQCKDGITNKLIRCINDREDMSVLIRSYGKNTEILIDRNQELINIYVLSQRGLCPPLYGKFNNGLVYGYIPGEVVKSTELGEPHTMKLVAERMAEWHRVEIPGPKTPKLFETTQQWFDQVCEAYGDRAANPRFHDLFSLDKLRSELQYLKQELDKLQAPVVFSHNDLLSANVIYNQEQDRVSFIDHEYASYNYRGYDIGNHFAEFAGFECHYDRYPSKKVQWVWLTHYLEAIQQAKPTDDEVEQLYQEVNKFSLASHLYWALWSMLQASISDIDFEYMEYAKLRLDEYYRRRDELLNL